MTWKVSLLAIVILSAVIFALWVGRRSIEPFHTLFQGPTAWARRVTRWVHAFWKAEAARQTITSGDLLGLVSVIIGLLSVGFAIVITRKDITKDSLRDDARRLHEQVATLEQALVEAKATIGSLEEESSLPHIVRPPPDAMIIGTHVDLAWDYKVHSQYTDYIIELQRVGRNPPSEPDIARWTEWCPEPEVGCLTRATDPGGQRSRLPARFDALLPPGTYHWRVVPAAAQHPAASDSYVERAVQTEISEWERTHTAGRINRIGEWSPLRSFTLYKTIQDRIVSLSQIRVGTNFIQDTPFSKRGTGGLEEGLDMELIKLVVNGCLINNRDPRFKLPGNSTLPPIVFDLPRCTTAANDLIHQVDTCDPKRSQGPIGEWHEIPEMGQLKAQILPVTDWADWQGMLKRKELDVFIGSTTKAHYRQVGDIKFTCGYHVYETELLAKSADDATSFTELVRSGRDTRIGVIEGTTNNLLADLLVDRESSGPLTVVSFKSFPALEAAMDRGEIEAMIIDEDLAKPLVESGACKLLTGLRSTKAWSEYISQKIGFSGREEFAIAVAVDGHEENDTTSLIHVFNEALRSEPVTRAIKRLKTHFGIDDREVSECEDEGRKTEMRSARVGLIAPFQ